MSERIRDAGATVSAVALIVGIVLVIIHWAEGSAGRILPALVAIAAAACLVYGFGICAFFCVVALLGKKRNIREAVSCAIGCVVFGLLVLAALQDDLVAAGLHGSPGISPLIAVLAIGGTMMIALFACALAIHRHRLRSAPDWAPRGRKVCPVCAEYARERARVCPYCGHPFV